MRFCSLRRSPATLRCPGRFVSTKSERTRPASGEVPLRPCGPWSSSRPFTESSSLEELRGPWPLWFFARAAIRPTRPNSSPSVTDHAWPFFSSRTMYRYPCRGLFVARPGLSRPGGAHGIFPFAALLRPSGQRTLPFAVAPPVVRIVVAPIDFYRGTGRHSNLITRPTADKRPVADDDARLLGLTSVGQPCCAAAFACSEPMLPWD